MPDVIDSFTGDYDFLSNFYPSPIIIDAALFYSDVDFDRLLSAPTVEHLYQGLKASTVEECSKVLAAPTPGVAKRMGRNVTLRDNFDASRIEIMTQLINTKFADCSVLGDCLIATGDATLIEGNTWGDTFWGVCNGVGDNHLGKILMARREVLKTYRELDLQFYS